jgi:hypothetical protein
MTKFLKKVFICGILLSSVSAYCNDNGVGVDLFTQLQDGKLSLNEGSVKVQQSATANMNLTVGEMADGLDKGIDVNENEILQANGLVVAETTGDGLFTQVFANSDAPKVVPVGGDHGIYHFGTDTLSDYIYNADVTSGSETSGNYAFKKDDGVWKTSDDGTVVQIIDLDAANSPFTLSGYKLLFTGTLATKVDGAWQLASDNSPLNKAALTIDSEATLTMGNKKADPEDSSSNNTDSTTFTVTEFGKVSGSIKLLDDDYDTENPPTQTQWETKAVFEPGSEAESGTTITNGTVDLGKYLSVKTDSETEKQSLEAKSTEGAFLNLALNGKVDVFSAIIPSDATGDAKSKTIDLFNTSNVLQVFPNITNKSGAKISIDVPYTYNIEGGSAYNSINDLADNIQADNKVSLNIASKNKLAGLFKDGADMNYTMNSKDTDSLSGLVDETIAYAHEIEDSGNPTQDVYLDVSSLKKFDNTFKSDEYLYSGEKGNKKLNVIPLDGDAYVIPYNDKSTAALASDSVEKFDLKASTSKNSDVIKKYIEPNMQNAIIKTQNGEALDTQPTEKSYSTELSKVGTSGNKKVLLLNSANNDSTVLLDESYLNVKSKDGSDINISTLKLNNGSNINLYGTNTVQNLAVNSSKLRIRGKFIWGV